MDGIIRKQACEYMIPEFPQFKPIELSDKEEVEKITAK